MESIMGKIAGKQVFTGRTPLYMAISGGVIALAILLSLVGLGMNFGADFSGGAILKYDVGSDFKLTTVALALSNFGATGQVSTSAGKTQLIVRTGYLTKSGGHTRAALEANLTAAYPGIAFVSADAVGATMTKGTLLNQALACLGILAFLLIYITYRIDFYSAVAAAAALAHDLLITWAFMVFFRFAFSVNVPFIAAMLMTGGLSAVNSVVTFSRIREVNRHGMFRSQSRRLVVDKAVTDALPRTAYTAATALVILIILFIAGAPLRGFAFPMIIGVLATTYSTLMLSGQIWAMCLEKSHGKQPFERKKGKRA